MFGKSFLIFGFLIAIITCGCGGTDSNHARNMAIANKVEKAIAAAPPKATLVSLETRALEAWKKKDSTFWINHLDESFVGFSRGIRTDKKATIAMFAEMPCEIGSYTFADEKMTPIGMDAIVLTAKLTIDAKCGEQKFPSPVVSSTLFIRGDETWRAAYHNEVPISETTSLKPQVTTKPTGEPKPVDSLTETLLAVEKKGWDGWKARDAAKIDPTITDDVTLIDPSGTVTVGKPAVLNRWTSQKCEIKTAEPVDAIGSPISPIISILTYKGTITGKCDAQPLAPVWGTTIYFRESGEWKAVYIVQAPAS